MIPQTSRATVAASLSHQEKIMQEPGPPSSTPRLAMRPWGERSVWLLPQLPAKAQGLGTHAGCRVGEGGSITLTSAEAAVSELT